MRDIGMVHGDIKTPNILCDREGCPMLIDFNAACDEGTEEAFGTPIWMAPELNHLRFYPVMSHKTDIYSLGCVLAGLLVRAIGSFLLLCSN